MAKKEVVKEEKVWIPSLKWLLKVLLTVYVVIVISFFSLNFLLKPYMRDIPSELTPWLNTQTTDNNK